MDYFTKRYHPPGTPPGTLTEVPEQEATALNIHLIDYCADEITIRENVEAAECRAYLDSDSMTWVHVQGHPSELAMRELGEIFGLHSLPLEDVLNTGQRPKIDEFDDQLFIVMSLPSVINEHIEVQQISFFLSKNFVISFYVGDFAFFNPIVRRLQDKSSRLRHRGSDFLLYCLLDTVIDQGFPVLEDFGLELEELEEQILGNVGREGLERIHSLKRELILLRRMLWPQREIVSHLLHGDHELIKEDSLIYLRDCYDHTIQVMELLETYREMTGSMLDIYLSSASNRMNEVMRVLTVIATIFIPLTFIVGVYGMNFDRNASAWNMPELSWAYGYPLIWLVMIVTVVTMLVAFRRRGWF